MPLSEREMVEFSLPRQRKNSERRGAMIPNIPITGTYRHNLDAKNRIFIPAKHRDALGSPLVVFPSIRDRSLKVYSVEEWRAFTEKIETMVAKEREQVLRYYNENSDTLTPDAQGRIVLNQNLVDYAGLAGGAVIVGCGKYAEIWSVEEHEKLKASTNVDDIRAALERLGL